MTNEESRMTHGQRYQAAQDWRTAQSCIVAAIVGLCFLVSALEPMLI